MQDLGYRKLIVWQKSDELAYRVYQIVQKFPPSEIYGLVSQMRRAAFSVPVNIVEGYARKSRKEYKQFINIALGSLAEIEYSLDFSLRLGYLSVAEFGSLQELRQEVGRLLWGLYESL